jgi:hypothetical protein
MDVWDYEVRLLLLGVLTFGIPLLIIIFFIGGSKKEKK